MKDSINNIPVVPTVYRLRTFDDPALKQACREVEPGESIAALVDAMTRAVRRYNGAGIAAPQLGDLRRVVMVQKGLVMINPVIRFAEDEGVVEIEGCLSYPKVKARVPRWRSVVVDFFDGRRQPRRERFEGFSARVVQHEIDHIDGICAVGEAWRNGTEVRPPKIRGSLATLVACAALVSMGSARLTAPETRR